MINFIIGKIVSKEENAVVIENNGLGFFLNVSANTLAQLPLVGEETKILTFMNVREDDISLFGFASNEEKDLFFKLISVSGIGPKVAISILSGMKISDFMIAIANEDVRYISTIKGLGKKTAERIIVELKDKIDILGVSSNSVNVVSNVQNSNIDDAVEALISLGMNRNEAYKVAKACATETSSVEEIITRSLRTMGR